MKENLNFCFTLNNTIYMFNITKEMNEDSENGEVITIELNTSNNTTNKKVLVKKIIIEGSTPEFQMKGSPGMTEQEQLDFVRTWLKVVHGHDGQSLLMRRCWCWIRSLELSCLNIPDGVKSFIGIFDHYFNEVWFQDLRRRHKELICECS